MAGISVKNTAAFHGGQDAYDYPMVTQADIDQAAGPLLAALTPATQGHLQAEVHPNERLAGQVQCQPAVTPDHPVGSNASQVTVSVSVTCHAQVYDHEAVVRLVTNALMQQADDDPGYRLRPARNDQHHDHPGRSSPTCQTGNLDPAGHRTGGMGLPGAYG